MKGVRPGFVCGWGFRNWGMLGVGVDIGVGTGGVYIVLFKIGLIYLD